MIVAGLLALVAGSAAIAMWLIRHEEVLRGRWYALVTNPAVLSARDRLGPSLRRVRRRFDPKAFIGLGLATGTAVLVAAAWLFGGIADEVEPGEPLTRVDQRLAEWLHDGAAPSLTRAMLILTRLGGWECVTGVTVVLGLVQLWKRQLRPLLLVVLIIPGGALVNVLLKEAFARARPVWEDPLVALGSYSFPSGHAMAATLLYGTLGVFIVKRFGSWRSRVVTGVAAVLLIVLIAFSRLYLGLHYLSDVTAGIVAGAAWIALCYTAMGAFRRHRSIRRRDAARARRPR